MLSAVICLRSTRPQGSLLRPAALSVPECVSECPAGNPGSFDVQPDRLCVFITGRETVQTPLTDGIRIAFQGRPSAENRNRYRIQSPGNAACYPVSRKTPCPDSSKRPEQDRGTAVTGWCRCHRWTVRGGICRRQCNPAGRESTGGKGIQECRRYRECHRTKIPIVLAPLLSGGRS